jgi:anti-anti-sigma factor
MVDDTAVRAPRSEMSHRTVLVHGHVDLAEAPRFANSLADAIVHDDQDVLVDCSQATFLDSAGMRVFAEAERLLESEGRRLYLRA